MNYKPTLKGWLFYWGDYMNMEIFIKRCFEIGIALLHKNTLTKEEKDFLNILNDFEEWIK